MNGTIRSFPLGLKRGNGEGMAEDYPKFWKPWVVEVLGIPSSQEDASDSCNSQPKPHDQTAAPRAVLILCIMFYINY
jgi:hypothetical protein